MTLRNSNSWLRLSAVLLCALVAPGFALAQEEEEAETGPQPTELIITPSEVELEVGDSLTLQSEVRDAEGNPMDRTVVFYSRRRRAVGVNPAGIVEAYRPGEHTLIAMVPKDPEDTNRRAEPAVMLEIPVTIPNPPVATVEVANMPGHLYTGTEIGLRPVVTDISGAVRNDVEVGWTTADSSVASVDALGSAHPDGRRPDDPHRLRRGGVERRRDRGARQPGGFDHPERGAG